MNATVEKLKAARELVARPGGWTQGVYAKTTRGNTIGFDCEAAACWCAQGALFKASEGATVSSAMLRSLPAYTVFQRAINSSCIATWNDAPERTQAEVVDAFDRAIALAEARGA